MKERAQRDQMKSSEVQVTLKDFPPQSKFLMLSIACIQTVGKFKPILYRNQSIMFIKQKAKTLPKNESTPSDTVLIYRQPVI